MSTYSLSEADGLASGRPARASLAWLPGAGPGIFGSLAWAAFGLSCLLWEDVGDWSRTHELGVGAVVIAALAFIGTVGADQLGSVGRGLRQRAPWLSALGVFLTLWELATAKFAWLPLPF